jgi:hypothetical protein
LNELDQAAKRGQPRRVVRLLRGGRRRGGLLVGVTELSESRLEPALAPRTFESDQTHEFLELEFALRVLLVSAARPHARTARATPHDDPAGPPPPAFIARIDGGEQRLVPAQPLGEFLAARFDDLEVHARGIGGELQPIEGPERHFARSRQGALEAVCQLLHQFRGDIAGGQVRQRSRCRLDLFLHRLRGRSGQVGHTGPSVGAAKVVQTAVGGAPLRIDRLDRSALSRERSTDAPGGGATKPGRKREFNCAPGISRAAATLASNRLPNAPATRSSRRSRAKQKERPEQFAQGLSHGW